LIGVGSLLAILLVASIVVALVQTVEPLPDNTPERAVQLYLEAVAGGDFEAAHNLLSAELKERCPVENLVSRSYPVRQLEDSRITLEGTEPFGDKTIVTARITTIRSNSPFGSSENSFNQRFTLFEEDGGWRFTSDPWPYQGCMKPTPMPRSQPTSVPTATPTAVPAPTPAAATSPGSAGDSR
jgi:hypothetical protein